MKKLLVAAVLFGSSFVSSASAEDFQSVYAEYAEAVQAGDIKKAAVLAEKAWRLAEEAGADESSISILAYNYAALIYRARPQDAIAPLERVIELAGEEPATFETESPQMLLLIARALAKPKNSEVRSLKKYLSQKEQAGTAPSRASAYGWTFVAGTEVQRGFYSMAEKSSAISVRHSETVYGETSTELATPILYMAVSGVLNAQNNRNKFQESYEYFSRGVQLFPPQESIETFDRRLANYLGWSSAARAYAVSHGGSFKSLELQGFNPRETLAESAVNNDPRVKWSIDRRSFEDCNIEFKKRRPPSYPDTESNDGIVGAAVIGYHLTEDGKTEGVRIITEVPFRREFGELSLEAVKTWELADGFDKSPECLKDHMITFQYILE